MLKRLYFFLYDLSPGVVPYIRFPTMCDAGNTLAGFETVRWCIPYQFIQQYQFSKQHKTV